MNVYLVRGMNEVGEAEVEVAVSADSPIEAEGVTRQHETISPMIEGGILVDFEVEESTGPVHLIGFPMQGV